MLQRLVAGLLGKQQKPFFAWSEVYSAFVVFPEKPTDSGQPKDGFCIYEGDMTRLLGNHKNRNRARKILSAEIIDIYSDTWRVSGGESDHIVTITSNSGELIYSCDCGKALEVGCSHICAVALQTEPHRINKVADQKRKKGRR